MTVGFDELAHAQTLVLSDEPTPPQPSSPREHAQLFVMTPLDLIARLERIPSPISTVVLAGRFGGDAELASFLLEAYPALRVVDIIARDRL